MAHRQKNARLNWKSTAGKLAALALPLLLGSSTPVIPQPPIKNPIERILRFVNTYDGGDCFFVAPVTVTEQEARLEGYGSSRDPFDVLDSGFRREIGFEAMIGVGPVTSFQCAAVAFLSRMRKQPGSVPQIEIDDTNLNTEGALTGSVTDFVNRHVDLILIAGDGTFSNLSGELRSSGGFQKSFNIQMSRTHNGPQLLLAIGSDTPLTALRSTGIADRAFARATAEAAETRQRLAVGAKYFKLQR